MRDMVPLDKPLSGTAVAAALQRHAPARASEGAEAVAGGRCGGDAPARGGGARALPRWGCAGGRAAWRARRPPGSAGGCVVRSRLPPIAPATMAGRASDRNVSSMVQSASLSVARLDDEQPADIEAELGEAVAVGLAEIRESPPRGDEHGRAGARAQRRRRQGEQETEGRRPVAVARPGHLMEDAAGKAGPRQVGMHLRHAERQVLGLGAGRDGSPAWPRPGAGRRCGLLWGILCQLQRNGRVSEPRRGGMERSRCAENSLRGRSASL